FFVAPHFFEPDLCAQLRSAAREASCLPGTVGNKEGYSFLKETTRPVTHAAVRAELLTLVQGRLTAISPQLQSHFHRTLTHCESPEFLVYKEGDFLGPHQDSAGDRQGVTVVIFLSDETDTPSPNSFCGGSLSFYLKGGLLEQV